jgi:uncharacterized protein (TIGR03437 family)
VQSVIVALNIAPGSGSDVYPAGLVFTGVPGSNPGSQTFSIANLTSQPITFTSTRLTQGGPSWFVHVPANGVIAPNQPAKIVVQPDFTNLIDGVYEGAIALRLSDGSTATVNLLAAVASSAGAAKRSELAANCSPLTITLSGSQQTLPVTLGQAATIEVLLTDACGPVAGANNSAAVSVAFSNHDQSLDLRPIPGQPGKWQQSWTPKNAAPTGVITLHIAASETVPTLLFKNIDVTANLVSIPKSQSEPFISSGAVQNAASFSTGTPVSPGSLITISGSGLANATEAHLVPPLPSSLGETQILLGGKPLPLLYASDGQINAQIPPDLPVNTEHQIMVLRGDNPAIPSVPDLIAVAAASPAVFTRDQNGRGQGAILNARTGNLADTDSPARIGDVVSIYCTGLGVVSPTIPAGQAAGSSPLSRTVNPVTVTIGGVAALVDFAGLAPGFAGLYQVNAFVPEGISSGNQVPVILNVANQQSQPVTIAVAPPR